jgi:hypothetical protein
MMYMPDAIRATLELMDAPADAITERGSYNLAGISFTPAEIAAEIARLVPGFTLDCAPDFRQAIADSWPQFHRRQRGPARLGLAPATTSMRWWTTCWTTCLFGRGGGTQLQLGYYRRLTELDAAAGIGGQWSLGASLSGGDERYMQSYFGVPVGLRLPAYQAEGGLRDATLSLNWQRALGADASWMLLAGVSVQQLLGPAGKSPIVERRSSFSARLGLAWRY